MSESSPRFVRRMSALARKGRPSRRPSASGSRSGFVDAPPPPRAPDAAAAAANADAFVNEGLERWKAQHAAWCSGGRASDADGEVKVMKDEESDDVAFDSDDLYKELVDPQYGVALPKRVKLAKLIEVLVEVWGNDGT